MDQLNHVKNLEKQQKDNELESKEEDDLEKEDIEKSTSDREAQ